MEKYKIIANSIRKRIIKGDYVSDQKLPSEKEIGDEFVASKLTVKKALDILVGEGLIIKRRGAGTFVKSLSVDEMERLIVDNQMRGTTAFNPDKKVTSKVLSFSVVQASQLVSRKLNLVEASPVYEIYRVRFVDGSPSVIEKTYMPLDVISGLTKKNVEGSIYEYIEEKLGLKIESGHRTITVRKAADFEADELALEYGDPVGIAEQTGYLNTGVQFEYSISVHRYDQFSVEMMVTHH